MFELARRCRVKKRTKHAEKQIIRTLRSTFLHFNSIEVNYFVFCCFEDDVGYCVAVFTSTFPPTVHA